MAMFKNSKIYVAGHTGLIGSAVFDLLKKKGYKNIITISHSRLDLTVQKDVEIFFKKHKPEHIFLCAGLTGGIQANIKFPAKFLHTNLAIQDNVFEAALKCKAKHLVFYGSSCMYPKNCSQPIKEEYLLTGEIEKTSEAYAAAKIAGILACKAYNNEYKTTRFIALVPNSCYGPNDNFDPESSHVLSALIRKFHDAKVNNDKRVVLWGSGKPKREFIYSSDVAEASIFAVNNSEKLENTHYNVGTGIDYSIKEYAEKIAKIVGYKGRMEWDTNKPDGAMRKLLDCDKIKGFGWESNGLIDEGLYKTYEWFKLIIAKTSN